jgi:hypothetical protein
VKNVGKPCDREGHARINGGRLEAERLVKVLEMNGSVGNCGVISGSWACRQITLPRQSATLHGELNRAETYSLLRRINTYLMRWARKKFTLLRAFKRFEIWWDRVVERKPDLFARWAWMRVFSWI